MKNNNKLALILSFIIFFGVLMSSVIVYFSYNRSISDNTRSIAELSATNIYSEINNELTKPIYVALTMANDTFVKDWLNNEGSAEPQNIIDYLEGIQVKYEYSSVFLVSDTTLDYYRHTGFHKTISLSDDHDVWYFDFVDSDLIYALDVDVDQANNTLTIFVNAKIFDDSNELIAVIGVGVEMNYIQEMIGSFETQYELEAFLINPSGIIQSHSNTEFIETRNIFLEEQYEKHEDLLKSSLTDMIVVHDDSKYIISRYVDELDWYIIVIKDTNVFIGFFRDYFITSFIILIMILISVYYLVNKTIKAYQDKVFKLAKTDYLTNLDNRRGFDMKFLDLKNLHKQDVYIYMIDIDEFKLINDQYGHGIGDSILKQVAQIISTQVSPYGIVSRWGGDEFAGIFLGEEKILVEKLKATTSMIEQDENLSQYHISISIGYTASSFEETADAAIKRVDQALYDSKAKGGHCITKK
ncbi:MAG: sensor domain-containing diguanylate cyclase [Acholeplasmataceae bacterium]|nr:sensor domain-containing diguanylate cyclase [Acholeplasmataceae bacterium]